MASSIIQELFQGYRAVQVTRYSQLASSSIIIYDHLITLDNEVELIWKSSWSIGKALFLLNRYYSLFSVLFNNYAFFSSSLTTNVMLYSSCTRFFHWQGWTGLVACMIAEAILQMRLYALYSLNKKVLAVMLVSYFGASAAAATIMGSVLTSLTANPLPVPGGVFCSPQNVSPRFYAFWIPILAFECLLCALALVRGFQTFRADGPLFQSGRHLVGILIRDSVLYFLVICSTYLTCLVVWIAAPTIYLEVPIGFSVAMSCVLANRVVLNVREVSRDVEVSRASAHHRALSAVVSRHVSSSHCGTLTDIEMAQLRSMRAAPETSLPFIVL